MKDVVVRSYGVSKVLGGTDGEHAAGEALFRQNRFWNSLVEIERDTRAQYRSIIEGSDAEMAALAAKAAELELAVQAARDERARARAAGRRKAVAGDGQRSAAIGSVYEQLKQIRLQMKERRAAAKEAAREPLQALELRRRERVKQAQAAAGLWWCHSEIVLNRYETARVRAMKSAVDLRFHRFEGDGTLGVRFTGDTSGGWLEAIRSGRTSLARLREATADELGSHMKARTGARPDAPRRMVLELRVGTNSDESGEAPVMRLLFTMHRPLPDGIDLKTISATRKRHGVGRGEWSLTFTFSREMSEQEVQDRQAQQLDGMPALAAGLNLGWRLVRGDATSGGGYEQNVRVGTFYDGQRVEHVLLDAKFLADLERAERLQSEIQADADAFSQRIKPLLKRWYDQLDDARRASLESPASAQPSGEPVSTSRFERLALRALRAKAGYSQQLIALAALHRADKYPLEAIDSDAGAVLDQWATRASRTVNEAFNLRRKALERRKHIYRNAAARLVRRCGLLVVEDSDLRQMARLEAEDGKENSLPQAARRIRQLAAPSELRLAIEQAAKREGRNLVVAEAAHITVTCHACGHVHAQRCEDLVVVCDHCGKAWDQDENAARNLRNHGLAGMRTSNESKT